MSWYYNLWYYEKLALTKELDRNLPLLRELGIRLRRHDMCPSQTWRYAREQLWAMREGLA